MSAPQPPAEAQPLAWRILQPLYAAPAEAQAQGGGDVVVETVGFVRENSDGGRYIDWTLEGGIGALEAGVELIVSPARLTDDTGAGTVYTAPPSAPVGVLGDAIQHLSKWLDLNECECESGHQCGRTEVERTRDQLRALAQQPAAVDGAMVERVASAMDHWDGSDHDSDYYDELALIAIEAVFAAQPGGDQE